MGLLPQDLSRLSSLLDTAMELDESARTAWLEKLQGEDALLVPTLRKLLVQRESMNTGDLLGRGPAFTLPGAEENGSNAVFHAGELVGPYRLERLIGQGGMGEVWLAVGEHGGLKRHVALKLPMLSARRSVLVQRFARERDIVGSLAHPNIARLYDAGIAESGQPYLALEYVEGQLITLHCEALKLQARERIELLLQVMRGVQHAHARLVIHRDIKPGNVIVTAESRAMLLDFGIAKLLDAATGQASGTELTQLGGRPLTLDYAAPEQVTGAPVSIATDVYALGALLYELLCGRRPFVGSRYEVEQSILGRDPARPGALRQGVISLLARSRAAELDTIALKALKKPPEQRYSTVEAFANDLQRWLDGEAISARGDSRWYRARKLLARHRLLFGAAGAVGVALISGLSIALWQAREARAQADIARTEAQTAEAVQSFLEGIFRANTGSQPDPLRARQRTALELLDAGAARVETELDSVPAAKVRVLKTLAEMYGDLGQYERVTQLLESRLAASERLGPHAGAVVVQSLADLALQMSRVDRSSDALRLLTRGDALASTLPASDHDARVTLDLAWANYYSRLTDVRGIAAARRAAESLARRAPSEQLVSALMLEGKIERANGLAQDAVRSLQRGVAAADGLPGGGGAQRVSLLLQLALAEAAAGERMQAETTMREALRFAERTMGAASTASIDMLANLGQLLAQGGGYLEAIKLMGDARSRLADVPPSPDKTRIMKSVVFVEAPSTRAAGRPERALELFDEWDALQRSSPNHPKEVALVLAWRAQAETDLGDFAEAHKSIAAAKRLRTQNQVNDYRGLAALAQAELSLALAEGDTARATEALHRWTEQPQSSKQPPPELLAATAEVRLAAEGPSVGGDAADIALQQLSRTTGGIPSARFRLLLVRARALIAAGRPGEAKNATLMALDINAGMCDVERSPERMLGLITLADADIALEQRDEARKALASADAIVRGHARLGTQYLQPLKALMAKSAMSGD